MEYKVFPVVATRKGAIVNVAVVVTRITTTDKYTKGMKFEIKYCNGETMEVRMYISTQSKHCLW